MSEAFAKMELREDITAKDVAEAHDLLKNATFAAAVDPISGKIDMQALRTGVSIRDRETMEQGSVILQKLLDDQPMQKDEALAAINEHLASKKLTQLRWKQFKEVLSELTRSETILERNGQLSKP